VKRLVVLAALVAVLVVPATAQAHVTDWIHPKAFAVQNAKDYIADKFGYVGAPVYCRGVGYRERMYGVLYWEHFNCVSWDDRDILGFRYHAVSKYGYRITNLRWA
jgi:hypothetical protein